MARKTKMSFDENQRSHKDVVRRSVFLFSDKKIYQNDGNEAAGDDAQPEDA